MFRDKRFVATVGALSVLTVAGVAMPSTSRRPAGSKTGSGGAQLGW